MSSPQCQTIRPGSQSPSAACPAPRRETLRFTLTELSGSLGDLGTFLPIVVMLVVTCGLDLGTILIGAGAMNVLSGLLFRQPIAVQPMKAIAAVAIAEGMVAGEIAAAGLLVGAAVLLMALSGLIDRLNGSIPRAIVRGIQLGVGLKLALRGLSWIGALPLFGWDSMLVALVAGGVILAFNPQKRPALLVVFVAGLGLLCLTRPEAFGALNFSPPRPHLVWPATGEWFRGLARAAVPQLPLTLLNSVVAVCALSAGYFPDRPAEPRKVALSVGLMNLIAVPLGCMPMCHGAGGLAGQVRFGARTGGSVVMLGGFKILIGALFGGALLSLLAVYPRAILGLMLAVAGVGLALPARHLLRGWDLPVVVLTGAAIVGVNTAAGFAVGIGVWGCCRLVSNRLQRHSTAVSHRT